MYILHVIVDSYYTTTIHLVNTPSPIVHDDNLCRDRILRKRALCARECRRAVRMSVRTPVCEF